MATINNPGFLERFTKQFVLVALIAVSALPLAAQLSPREKAWLTADGTGKVTAYYSTLGSTPTVKRDSAGTYGVTFDAGSNVIPTEVAQVSSATAGTRCKLGVTLIQNGNSAYMMIVFCYDVGGNRTDSAFNVLYYRESRANTAWFDAYAINDNPSPTTTFTANSAWSWNSKNATNTITKTATGFYDVTFSGVAGATKSGTVLVTAAGNNSIYCNSNGWTATSSDIVAHVACFTAAGFAADSEFAVSFLSDVAVGVSSATDRTPGGYAWADQSSASSYTPNTSYSLNSQGGNITAAENGFGHYNVTFGGFTGYQNYIALVTPYGTSNTCSIGTTTSTGSVGVECRDPSGQAVDATANTRFEVLYLTDGVPGTGVLGAPVSVDFGKAAIGATISQQIPLTNSGAGPVIINSIGTSVNSGGASDFQIGSVCATIAAGGPGCFITVSFTPSTDSTTERGSLNIATSSGIVTTIAISGIGTPNINITPAALSLTAPSGGAPVSAIVSLSIVSSIAPSLATGWFTASYASWLTGSPTSGSFQHSGPDANGNYTYTSTVTLTANSAGISPAILGDTITFNEAPIGDAIGRTTVNFTVTPATNPLLILSPNPLSLTATSGATSASQSVTLTYTTPGTGAPTWSATANSGWLSLTPSSGTMNLVSNAGGTKTYTATVAVNGNPAGLSAGTQSGNVIFSATGTSAVLPVSFLVNASNTPALTLAPNPVTLTAVTGGAAAAQSVTLTYASTSTTAPSWSALPPGASWVTVTPASGTMVPAGPAVNGVTTYTAGATVNANPAGLSAGAQSATITFTAGAVSTFVPVSFTVNSATVQTISHFPDGAGWTSTIILTNKDSVPAQYALTLWNDSGTSYTPPLASGSPSGTIPVGGTAVIATGNGATLLQGWGQVASNQLIGGAAIFRYNPTGQEAAVPLLTNGGTKLYIPWQLGGGATSGNLALGVALANPNANAPANITEIIRDLNGNVLSTRTFAIPALGHTAFNPNFPASLTSGAAAQGVMEYDSDVTIYSLGIRSAGSAFTSVDAIVPQAAATQTISHFPDGAGWTSTLILTNKDTVPAQYTTTFWNDSGAAYTPPLASGSAPAGTIPVGGTVVLATADGASLLQGWGQISSSQMVGGAAIFRYNPTGQEAAVPLLTNGGTKLYIPWQLGSDPVLGSLALGVALANPSATQTANVTELIRDLNGNTLSTRTFSIAPLSHTAFNPVFPSSLTSGAAAQGVMEYDSNVAIYSLGIRSAGAAFTSVETVK